MDSQEQSPLNGVPLSGKNYEDLEGDKKDPTLWS